MRNQVCIIVFAIFSLFQCDALPQRRRNSAFSLRNRNRNIDTTEFNAFDSIDEPFVFNFNPPTIRTRGQDEFEKVRKSDLIQNLSPPRLNPVDERIAEPLVFNFNPQNFRTRGQDEFEKVRKTDFSRDEFDKVRKSDLIQNLAPPRFGTADEIVDGPIPEFEYVPPTYLENRDPPYNVTLLTLPLDDELVSQDTTEEVPVINDPRYTKFRPTRISAFGSELVYLQSRKEIEQERRRQLEGAK